MIHSKIRKLIKTSIVDFLWMVEISCLVRYTYFFSFPFYVKKGWIIIKYLHYRWLFRLSSVDNIVHSFITFFIKLPSLFWVSYSMDSNHFPWFSSFHVNLRFFKPFLPTLSGLFRLRTTTLHFTRVKITYRTYVSITSETKFLQEAEYISLWI